MDGRSWFRRWRSASGEIQAAHPLLRRSDAGLEDKLKDFAEASCKAGGRGDAIAALDTFKVKLDGSPRYVPEMLSRQTPHDEDYRVFRFFVDPEAVILDIGANWGYSAGSIWSVGSACRIISFEAIPMYRECLQRIRNLRPDSYDFFMTALGDRDGTMELVIPVVNDTALTALASASAAVRIDSLVAKVAQHIHRWMPDAEELRFQLCRLEVPVSTLDRVCSSNPSIFGGSVDAIKVDVEGLEYEVLKGSVDVLERNRPLVMAEGGNRRDGVRSLMESLGFVFAERAGKTLVLTDGIGTAVNGFFLHRDKLADYKNCGMLD